MSPRPPRPFGTCVGPLLCALVVLGSTCCVAPRSVAQTTQPFLFAGTYDSASNTSGLVTLLRNGTTGVLTILPNTAVVFKDPCTPTTIDPTGNFLFAVCGEGVAMYTLDATTGVVSETATSPYSASVSTGQAGVLVVAESTGQYVYLLKVGLTQSPAPSTFTLDSFQIDPATPSLVPVNSQALPLNAAWVASAADPARHGLFIYTNQDQPGSSPTALLFPISFDFSTGLANIPTTGLTIGSNARSMSISPNGAYLVLGWGETIGSVTEYQISSSDFSLALVASINLGPEDTPYGSYTFPDSVLFSPGGNLLYGQAPPANFAGGSSLPFLVFDPTTLTVLPTPPIPVSNANFLNGIADPQAPFTYVGNAGPTTYGISVYAVDLSTGLPSQPGPISAPFYPQDELSPLFVTIEQNGQGILGPTLGTSPGALTFGPTSTGQTSNAQTVTLKSLGAQSVSLSGIQISGANAADFTETDNCLSSPVLPTNHTCTIALTYAPSSAGTSQATLFVTDNAAGSPQFVTLSGTAVIPSPGAPAVALNPSGTLAFPGTPTQGTSTSPQAVTLTNSGGASLQIGGASLGGYNVSDFSISANTCSGSLAAGASCAISIVFSPLAAGVRTTTLTITDSAANSPQSLTITGTASPSATITASAGGSTTATLSPGQTATYNLVITPGAGFTGTFSFTCSGAPFGASCTVPASVSVSNGNPVSLTVSISTLGASQPLPAPNLPDSHKQPDALLYATILLLAFCMLSAAWKLRSAMQLPRRPTTATLALSLCLILVLVDLGCSSVHTASTSGSSPASPSIHSAATPSIQPAGGTFTAAQTVSITDATSGATVYYTTDGTTPSAASTAYSAPFSLTSAATVQAIAAAAGYNDSSVGSAAFKFQTPAATYPITIGMTAIPKGSTNTLQLDPILLTLIVN